MKRIEDMTFGEIWDTITYPSYLALRKTCNIPLTIEQQEILNRYNVKNRYCERPSFESLGPL